MNIKKHTTKKSIATATGKALYSVADLFSLMLCKGQAYEPKVPQKLLKNKK